MGIKECSLTLKSQIYMQGNMKLNEEQIATLSSPKAVREYLENQRENIENIIKQNLAVGDIFKRENLQVLVFLINKWFTKSMCWYETYGKLPKTYFFCRFQPMRLWKRLRILLQSSKNTSRSMMRKAFKSRYFTCSLKILFFSPHKFSNISFFWVIK